MTLKRIMWRYNKATRHKQLVAVFRVGNEEIVMRPNDVIELNRHIEISMYDLVKVAIGGAIVRESKINGGEFIRDKR